MIILVTGGRAFNDWEFIFASLDNIAEDIGTIEAVIHGNTQGVDKLADSWCLSRGVQPIRCPALFQKIPDAAKYRNRIMARLKPDLVVAFPGKSDTFDMIEVARQNHIQEIKRNYE
jgi:hypothetical protein